MQDKIKAALNDLSVSFFILRVRYILSMLAGNSNFPNLPFPTTEVEADVEALRLLDEQVVAGNRINVKSRDEKRVIVHQKMTAIAAYVNGVAMGNPSALETSGFEFVKAPTARTLPTAITKISCRAIAPVGSVKVNWSASKERDYYLLEKRVGELGTWEEVETLTKTNCIVSGLTFKQDVYFRVAAVNGAGISAWSDVAMVVVV